MGKHWNRLKRSLSRRWREWRLPAGYARLGTRYGGWWINTRRIGREPLLIDCGLGVDISFPVAFLERFPGVVHQKVEDGPGLPLGRSFGVKLWPTLVFLRDGRVLAQVSRPDDDQVLEGLIAITAP